MQIPTVGEVAAYAAEIGFKLDPDHFIDYWEERGWKFKGGVPMASWKATVRNWKRMDAQRQSTPSTASTPQDPAEARRQEAARRRAAVIQESAQRIIAMRSWIESGKPCPYSNDPQEEIDREKTKIRDHYGPAGIDDLRRAVNELKKGANGALHRQPEDGRLT